MGFYGKKSQSRIVFAFRGTESIADWITNVQMSEPETVRSFRGFLLHRGFRDAANRMWQSALSDPEVPSLLANAHQIFVTGHSLGGAIATLFSSYIMTKVTNAKIHLYTFGAPKLGSAHHAIWLMGALKGRWWRITHARDPGQSKQDLSRDDFFLTSKSKLRSPPSTHLSIEE